MEGGETRFYSMDFFELAKIIFGRVQKLEPENVVKIMGCIFLKEPSEQEMMQLAFGPDAMLLSKISDAKNMLGMFSPKNSMSDMQIGSYPPSVSHTFSSPINFHIPAPFWDPQLSSEQQCPSHNFDFVPRPYNTDSFGDRNSLQSQSQPMEQLDAVNHINNYYYHPEATAFGGGMASRTGRRSHSLSDLPTKACHYFNKGYCKHGMNCRYSHAQSFPDGYSHAFSSNLTDYANEDHVYTPKSLENLEMEITGILRSRRGVPVSIASLPMLYYEKYGKNLQAEGYLTESQRHGKSGFNLTKLLSHLRKSIRLIERPHGQHSVILAEDAPRYMECRNERNDLCSTVSSSHQIYLTFPAESTFTEDDVSNYFKQYGQVRDVRIPCQDKRMFGFVSFVHPETVNMILMKRNPHYICGARVLVKPYREKTKIIDRMYSENIKSIVRYPSHHPDMDREVTSVPEESESSRLLRYQLIEDKEMMELERGHRSKLNLAPKTLTHQHCLTQGMEDLTILEGPSNLLLNHFSYALDTLNNGCASDNKARQIGNSFSDQESNHLELPESPFASAPVGSSISAVI
ncbi:zinc finger CCCH domain-containing protein 54-like [Musa acuminata AAA Group]|uniref:zinc finger CCCH domain-containing protein 54-like n=1 Tax=Musa acuminata AAA Group TaxID=214697 RepID=UPI0031D09B8D